MEGNSWPTHRGPAFRGCVFFTSCARDLPSTGYTASEQLPPPCRQFSPESWSMINSRTCPVPVSSPFLLPSVVSGAVCRLGRDGELLGCEGFAFFSLVFRLTEQCAVIACGGEVEKTGGRGGVVNMTCHHFVSFAFTMWIRFVSLFVVSTCISCAGLKLVYFILTSCYVLPLHSYTPAFSSPGPLLSSCLFSLAEIPYLCACLTFMRYLSNCCIVRASISLRLLFSNFRTSL